MLLFESRDLWLGRRGKWSRIYTCKIIVSCFAIIIFYISGCLGKLNSLLRQLQVRNTLDPIPFQKRINRLKMLDHTFILKLKNLL